MTAYAVRNKDRANERARNYYHENRDKALQKGRERYKSNEAFRERTKQRSSESKKRFKEERPEEYRRHWRNKHLQRSFGISYDDYTAILSSQNESCAICGSKEMVPGSSDSLCVDHDHKTGLVRGLLCMACNRGLGCFKDNSDLLHKAFIYISKQRITKDA